MIRVERVEEPSGFDRFGELLEAYEGELPDDLRHAGTYARADLPSTFAVPNAAYLAWYGEAVAGCVATVRLDRTGVVLQRLYVLPAYRRLGAAFALVQHAIDACRDAGYRRIVLDTDRRRLASAYRLYERFGFRECEPYGTVDYAEPTFMERTLD